MERNRNLTKRIVESSVLIAFATVLSMLKLVDLPYGGSVTAASMLPIAIIAYRHGVGMGLASGLVYATIQQLLGLNTLSYATSWKAVVAIIILDYIVAFTVVGFAGIAKGKLSSVIPQAPKRQSAELGIGVVFVCILRYVCHTVTGATVWAGLSIPNEAALIYSLGYNATYMIPETIVTALAAVWLGSVIDLSKKTPERFIGTGAENEARGSTCELLSNLTTLIIILTVVLDTVLIAPHLQNEASGEFDFSGLSSAPSLAIAIITIAGAISAAAVFVARKVLMKKQAENSEN